MTVKIFWRINKFKASSRKWHRKCLVEEYRLQRSQGYLFNRLARCHTVGVNMHVDLLKRAYSWKQHHNYCIESTITPHRGTSASCEPLFTWHCSHGEDHPCSQNATFTFSEGLHPARTGSWSYPQTTETVTDAFDGLITIPFVSFAVCNFILHTDLMTAAQLSYTLKYQKKYPLYD